MEKKTEKEKGGGLIKQFKDFIARGNVIDLAVGVVIGSAFGKIVSSLVDNILMPLIGIILGGIDFTSLTAKVGDATIAYGIFIQNVIDFLIIALCIFLIVKVMNKFIKKQEEAPVVNEELETLKEIRDVLKKKNK